MSKIRVHELAKELNISSKTIIETLKKDGVEVASHMSTLDDSAVSKVRGSVGGNKQPAAAAKPAQTASVKPAEPVRTGEAQKPAAQSQGSQRPVNRTQQQGSQQQRQGTQQGGQRPQSQHQNSQRPQGQQQNRNNQGSQQNRPASQQSSSQQRTGGTGQQNRNNSQGNRPPYNSQQGNRPQGQQQNRTQGGYNKPQGGQNSGGAMRAQNKPGTQGQRPDNRGNNNASGGTSTGTGSNTRTKTFNNNSSNNRNGQGRPGGYKPAGGYQNNNYRNNNNNRNKKPAPKPAPVKAPEPVEEELKIIQIPATLTIKELAMSMRKSGSEVVKMLFKKGQMININSTIDFDTAAEIAEEYNIMVELEEEKDIFEEAFKDEPEDEKNLVKRPPVVVVMGHVDHGKTSLLDAIRKSKVTQGEAGGITQHIGAYTVEVNGNPITFLDTPGHEAFTAMRMRGAQVTDIAVLVVAADDGVMPQTVEAINHAKAAGVEIIVAVNKIDKVGANPDRVKQELTEHGILTEDWGGETICVPVSALNKTGIDNLLEMIILASEVKELKANPKKKARGTVIEAQLDKGRGPVATILVQNGTLNVGDPIVAGSAFGKIRAMMDDKGRRVKKAGPSIPVEILGLNEVPSAGDAFYIAENEKQARTVAETVVAKTRTEMIKSTPQKVSLDDLFTQIQSGNMKELNVVVKADVQGSVEAVKQSLEKLSNEEVRVRIIHGGVGTITESDVMLASASNAIIIGFNVRPETMAKTFAETEKVDIRLYKVIYNAIEDVMNAMKGMLDPVYEEKIIGHAVVRQTFKASGVGVIAGSYVTDGKFQRGCSVRVFRGGEKIHEGELDSLKRFKDDVKEVATNYECGLVIKKFNDLKEDDTVEAYIMVEVPR